MDLDRSGLLLHGKRVPLLSGEMQFWRLDPADWERGLRQLKALGLPIVATYLSWRRHELQPGSYDFSGRTDARLDVVRFLKLCREVGMYVHLKPGPWICAEEPAGGYPDWLVADASLQVLDSTGKAVRGYNPPFQSPIPSPLHPEYLGHARRWLEAVDEVVRPFCYPDGPVVMVQLDNEPSLTFHDRMFESDYNPVVTGPEGLFARWLEERGEPGGAFEAPRQLRLEKWQDLHPYRLWAEFKEWMLARHIATLREFHIQNGLGEMLFTVNLNEHAQLAAPNHWARLQSASGLAGYDYYFIPPFKERDLLNVALSANYSLAVAPLGWAPEMMSGIWISPGVDEDHPGFRLEDLEFLHMLGIAFGLKGLNFYMGVNRENWASAPIQANGEPGDTFEAVQRVVDHMRSVPGFHQLEPQRQVGVLFYHPYAREAFIASGAEIQLARDGLGDAYRRFTRLYQELLLANYNPAIVDPDVNLDDLANLKLLVLPAGAWMDRKTQQALFDYVQSGGNLVFTPGAPELDESFETWMAFPGLPGHDPIDLGQGRVYAWKEDEVIQRLHAAGCLPRVSSDRTDVLTVLQKNSICSVLYVIHTGESTGDVHLKFQDIEQGRLYDLFDGNRIIDIARGQATLNLHPHRVWAYRIDTATPFTGTVYDH